MWNIFKEVIKVAQSAHGKNTVNTKKADIVCLYLVPEMKDKWKKYLPIRSLDDCKK